MRVQLEHRGRAGGSERPLDGRATASALPAPVAIRSRCRARRMVPSPWVSTWCGTSSTRAEEPRVVAAGLLGQRLDPGGRGERRAGLVERQVAVAADAEHLEVDAAGLDELRLVGRAGGRHVGRVRAVHAVGGQAQRRRSARGRWWRGRTAGDRAGGRRTRRAGTPAPRRTTARCRPGAARPARRRSPRATIRWPARAPPTGGIGPVPRWCPRRARPPRRRSRAGRPPSATDRPSSAAPIAATGWSSGTTLIRAARSSEARNGDEAAWARRASATAATRGVAEVGDAAAEHDGRRVHGQAEGRVRRRPRPPRTGRAPRSPAGRPQRPPRTAPAPAARRPRARPPRARARRPRSRGSRAGRTGRPRRAGRSARGRSRRRLRWRRDAGCRRAPARRPGRCRSRGRRGRGSRSARPRRGSRR